MENYKKIGEEDFEYKMTLEKRLELIEKVKILENEINTSIYKFLKENEDEWVPNIEIDKPYTRIKISANFLVRFPS